MRTKRTVLSGILALGLLSAACGGPKTPTLRVSLFAEIEILKIMNERFAEFTRQTGIAVKPDYVAYSSYREKLTTQLSAHNAPDVIWVESENFAPLYFSKALLPLNERIAQDKVDLKGLYAGVLDRFTVDGQVYALPQDTAPVACLYYNRALFRKAGLAFPNAQWRWDDLLLAARKLRSQGKDGAEVWGFQDNYAPEWVGAIFSNGGRLVDDVKNPTRCLIGQAEAVEAIEFLASLMLKHKVTPNSAAGEKLLGLGQDLFAQDRLGMVRTGLWITPFLRKVPGLDWDVAPFPRGPRAKVHGWSTGGSGWAISRDVRDEKAAWALVRFLGSEETLRVLTATGYVQPAIQSLAASETFLKSTPPDNKGFLVKAVDHAHYRPFHARWDEAERTIIQPKLDLVWLGKLDARSAMQEAAKEVDAKIFGRQ